MTERHEAGLFVKLGLILPRIGQCRAGADGVHSNAIWCQGLRGGLG